MRKHSVTPGFTRQKFWSLHEAADAVGGLRLWDPRKGKNWRSLKYLPLDEQSRLLLPVQLPEDDPVLWTFVEAFHETWDHVPSSAKAEIIHHWLHDQAAESIDPWSPRLDLLPDFKVSDTDGWGSEVGVFASCRGDGHILSFCADLLYDQSMSSIVCIIAHELAHVWQIATGCVDILLIEDGTAFERDAGDIAFTDRWAIEDDANDLIAAWGFDPSNLP